MPEVLAAYVGQVLPSKSFQHDGLRLLGARDFFVENLNSSPGLFVREFGFWTVATLPNGSAVCWDTETGRAVCIDGGQFYYRKRMAHIVGKGGPITRSSIDVIAKIAASSFDTFVERLASGESYC